MKKYSTLTALSLGSLLLLSACGSSSPTPETNDKGMTNEERQEVMVNDQENEPADTGTTVTTENGTFSDQNKLPEGWPEDVPQYPQTTIQYSGTVNPATGASGMAAAFMSTQDVATVAKDYTEAIKNAGWKIESTMDANGAKVISATKDTRTLAIYMGGDAGGTMITVGIENK